MKQIVARYDTEWDYETDNAVESMNTMIEDGWFVKCVVPLTKDSGVIVVYEMTEEK